MDDRVPFADLMDMLESSGWQLASIWPPYRIFTRAGSGELPILVEVTDGFVSLGDVERVWRTLQAA